MTATAVELGAAEAIARRLVAEGRYESVSEAVRAGLRRLAEDAAVVDRLVAQDSQGNLEKHYKNN